MKTVSRSWLLLLMVLVWALPARAAESGVFEQFSKAYQESKAYQQYERRPKSDLSKLIYLMDRFRNTDFVVRYNGSLYDSEFALTESRKYISRNYAKEPAAEWVKEHAYRSRPGGKVIFIETQDSESVILRDILLKELEQIS